MTKWELRLTKQCLNCPWRKDADLSSIPRYNPRHHSELENTMAEASIWGQEILLNTVLNVMACHYSTEGDDRHCIGWLMNQVGPGNNIPLRLHMRSCRNVHEIELVGEQHECFEDTLPENRKERARGSKS